MQPAELKDAWRITIARLKHTGVCIPSIGQCQVSQKKRGDRIPPGVLEQISGIVTKVRLLPAQMREVLIHVAPTLRRDSQSLRNLRFRAVAFAAKDLSNDPTVLASDLDEDALQRCLKIVFMDAGFKLGDKGKKGIGGGKSKAVNVMQQLQKCLPGFQYHVCADEDGNFSGAIFMTPCQLERMQRYGDVVFFDGKGRVNQNGFSLFAPTAVDEHGRIWTVCYAMVESEKCDDALAWILGRMVAMCDALPNINKAVFTDKGVSEHIIHTALPNSAALLCTWHMNLNLSGRFNRNPRGKEIEAFVMSKLVNARTEEAFAEAWAEFQDRYPGDPTRYLTKEWLPCKHRWARPWRNSVMNMGYKADSV
eukprot:m.188622 g.188622  ORF g.188622 m.188622 type:complete len:364 (+) comp10026_c0_seq4:481-1572(+)